jgi:hypothetical protein
MQTKLFALVSVFIISTLPILAHADIRIMNNTDSFVTAAVGSSPCSSEQGNAGVAKPHQPINIPHIVFTIYCGLTTSCTGHVFMTKDCGISARETVTVNVDAIAGRITSYDNHDKEHYNFIVTGQNVVINQIKSSPKSWFRFLF